MSRILISFALSAGILLCLFGLSCYSGIRSYPSPHLFPEGSGFLNCSENPQSTTGVFTSIAAFSTLFWIIFQGQVAPRAPWDSKRVSVKPSPDLISLRGSESWLWNRQWDRPWSCIIEN
ncbi:hypothetical protein V8F20_000357 [Naviculisporaceae sp. PSN 640]